MFWDGHRWLPGEGSPTSPPHPSAPGRGRRWISTGVMVATLAVLVVPFSGAFAKAPSASTVLDDWKSTSQVVTYQESSRSISWKGSWYTAYNDSYLGDKVRSTDAAGARVGLTFSGTAIAWVGPVDLTRGSARVYLDGTLIRTVSTWSDSFLPTRILFRKSWASMGKHRIVIVTNGTSGHPTVAVDAFVVRKDALDVPPLDDGGQPIGDNPSDPPEPRPNGRTGPDRRPHAGSDAGP